MNMKNYVQEKTALINYNYSLAETLINVQNNVITELIKIIISLVNFKY